MEKLAKAWMSALRIPVHVTKTRTAPTLTVLIAALVNKALMEMVKLVKISTSVLWNPVLVTETLVAPTLTVLTAVLVNKDLQEMVQFVKVCECKRTIHCVFITAYSDNYITFYMELNAVFISIICYVQIFMVIARS